VRKAFSSIWIALFVLIFLSACNTAPLGSRYSDTSPAPVPQPPVESPAPSQFTLSECGTTITSPGRYDLTANLITSGDEPCITIADVKSVVLDCDGNSITGDGEYGISVLNASGVILENCKVVPGTADGGATLLSLNNVIGATVTGCTFGSNQSDLGGVYISDSTNVIFGNQIPGAPINPSVSVTTNPSISDQLSNAPPASNTLYGFLSDSNNVNLVIEGNALTSGTSTGLNAFVIGIFGSQNTHVVNNTVNGLGSPIPIEKNGVDKYSFIGSDDDLLIQDESGPGSLISGNIFVNTFDAGIETIGFMNDITISNNYIDNVATGIGGWYYISISNAQYRQNIMTNIESRGFHYNRCGGLRLANGPNQGFMFNPAPAGMPAETVINFTQNQFVGNTLSEPIVFQGKQVASFEAAVYSGLDYVTGADFPGTDPTPQQFNTLNNTLASNLFDKEFGPLLFSKGQPWTYTGKEVIDGGANMCSGSQTSVPSVYPTIGYQTGPLTQITPIECGSGN